MRAAPLACLCLLTLGCDPADKGLEPSETGDESPPPDSELPDETADSQDSNESGESGETGGLNPELCSELGLSVQPWQDAEDSAALGAVAADLTLSTEDGDWTFSEAWTGCDVYLFIPSQPNQAQGWDEDLWEQDRDTKNIFDELPRNTQLLFLASERSEESQAEALAMIRAGIEGALADMEEEDAAWWEPRIHYVLGRDREQPGWLGETMSSPGWGVGVDRFQKIRYIGSFADPRRYDSSRGWFEPNISYVSWEPVYYNFEAERADAMALEGADTIRVFDGDVCSGSVTTELTLPDPAEMDAYDTLTLDLTMACVGDGEYGDCPAWDYMAYLWACDLPVDDNPYTETPCQPYVAETLGVCAAGPGEGASCRADADCLAEDGSTGTCAGYVAAIPADTLTGSCDSPTGETREASYTCNSEGTGYGDLACACDTEIGRWITTYHREGRWVHDVSPVLPHLSRGGDYKLRFETSGPYELTLDLRLSNQGKEARPQETTWLFGGGWIYEGSNALYEPVTLEIPADAVKVELATVISGHGADSNNCGEFCDMGHYFVINGDDANAVVRSFPESETTYGCRDQVADGTIPNQYGTWWYGRAGWCPGKEVPTVVTDITDQVVIGGENTFEFYNLFDGAEYTGSSYNRMASWLVVSY